jgi:hypothetical protein
VVLPGSAAAVSEIASEDPNSGFFELFNQDTYTHSLTGAAPPVGENHLATVDESFTAANWASRAAAFGEGGIIIVAYGENPVLLQAASSASPQLLWLTLPQPPSLPSGVKQVRGEPQEFFPWLAAWYLNNPSRSRVRAVIGDLTDHRDPIDVAREIDGNMGCFLQRGGVVVLRVDAALGPQVSDALHAGVPHDLGDGTIVVLRRRA